MQFALQALPFSRQAQNEPFFAPAAACAPSQLPGARMARLRAASSGPRAMAHQGVRILRNEGHAQGGRLLISGRMADVCAALNRLALHEYACG